MKTRLLPHAAPNKTSKSLWYGIGFGVVGVALLLRTFAAIQPDSAALEAESAVSPLNATVQPDTAASGGSYLAFEASPTPEPTTSPTPPSGSLWPDATNTGYKNAPGYPGSLKSCAGPIQSNTRYEFCNFSSGAYIGSSSSHPVNVIFYGCRFASNAVGDANVAIYGDNITFEYATFEPSADTAPPTPYGSGYQYGIDVRFDGQVTVSHSDFWGWGNAIQFGFSTQAKPFVVRNSWFHDARADGGIDHTDAILSNSGGPSYMVFDHNTIVSVGNTQGLALQTEPDGQHYDHVQITNNYFSGFGYTVAIGENSIGDTNITFTGNTFGTDIKPVFGVLYDDDTWNSAQGNVWRNNKWKVVPGSYYAPTSDDGKFWWPDGTKRTVDYNG